MSIRKLFGTAACIVIIGVSAGVSYGQFQRLTAQVAPSPLAEPVAQSDTVEPVIAASGKAEFVTAGTTTWKAAEKSGVVAPTLSKPVALVQPEPPLQSFVTVQPSDKTRTAPAITGFVALTDAIILEETAMPQLASVSSETEPAVTPVVVRKKVQTESPVPPALAFATTSGVIVAPGTLRRFRNQAETGKTEVADTTTRDEDGSFEQVFPDRKVAAAPPRRPNANMGRSPRAVQRQARFQRVWSTGVYR